MIISGKITGRRGKYHSVELHKIHSSFGIIRGIKSRRRKLARPVICM
jgi:hypothetical protein